MEVRRASLGGWGPASDLSLRGYTVEASELSYAVLHCAAFLVACAAAGTRHSVRPFVHHIVNNRCRADQHRPVPWAALTRTPTVAMGGGEFGAKGRIGWF